MFTKSITAGVLAVSLSFTSLAPSTASAQISEEDAVVGLVTLLLLGTAIHNSRERRDPAPVAHPNRGWRVLPADCRRDVVTRGGGTVRMFTTGCLSNSYRSMNRLPDHCYIAVRNRNGQQRAGYRAPCLRDAGFRTDRH